jgi:tetratricopeptide (TPR) repeat protein
MMNRQDAALNTTTNTEKSLSYMAVFRMAFWCLVVFLLLTACAPELPNRSGLEAITAVPTLDTQDPVALCDAIDTNWARDWDLTIRALQSLRTLNALCDDGIAIDNRLYTAYIAYGTELEQQGREQEAIAAYQSAMEYNPSGSEAVARLAHMGIVTPQPPPRCEPQVVQDNFAAMPTYTPTTGSYVQINERRFSLDGITYPVHGIVYYPRDYPGIRFLTQMDVQPVAQELDLMRAAGINTLRIFLYHDAMFTCIGNGAVPLADAFIRLDGFIREAAARSMKLILTLNDSPDLTTYQLYSSPRHTVEQIEYIVTRYRDEPAIMAWDLREGGDYDYLGVDGVSGVFTRDAVLAWLAETAILVRQIDPNHLITASWEHDSQSTASVVDFVSFQHFGNIDDLRQAMANVMDSTDKPVLLSGIGYSTFSFDEQTQRTALQLALQATRTNGLAGWMIYTAFDTPLSVTCTPPDEQTLCPDAAAYHFGIWNTSYFPKLSLDIVLLTTGGE